MENTPVDIFRGRHLPVRACLAGYSALIARYDLATPLHHEMAAVSPKNVRQKEGGWAVYPSALSPGSSTIEHLIFALKYEGVQLLTLKKIFKVFDPVELENAVRGKPTSGYLRRLWYLFEWLAERRLDLTDASAGSYVKLIDIKQQYATETGVNIRRFRVTQNLPGTHDFCPVVYRTHRIDAFITADLAKKARDVVKSAPRELIARAAAFLLLSDSKASFAIEGEHPPKDRLARWGAVVGRAGALDLDREALIALQHDLIGDARFVRTGLRSEGGFVGRRDKRVLYCCPKHVRSVREQQFVEGAPAQINLRFAPHAFP